MAEKQNTKFSDKLIAQARIPDEAPIPVVRMAADGSTLYSNPKAQSIKGMINPKNGRINPKLVKAAKTCLKEKRGTSVDFENENEYYEVFLTPILDHNYINMYGKDVTEARASVARIAGLAKFPNENPNPVIRATPNGKVLFANEAARALKTVIRPGPQQKLSKSLSLSSESAAQSGTQKTVHHKSGAETYLFTFMPVDGETYLNIYGRDITAEIEAQKAEVAAKKALEVSNALLERRVAERTASVRLLQNIVLAANNADSLEAALQAALHEVCIYTGWQVGHAYVAERHDGKNRLIPTGLWHFDTASTYSKFRKATERELVDGGKDLPGEVLASGKVEWVEHLSCEKNSERLELAKNAGLKSGMAFPVLTDGSVVGVLEFFSRGRCSTDAAIVETLGHIGTQLGSVAKRRNSEIAVAASQADAAIAHSRLSNAIEVMGQGFALFDVEDNLILFNKRYSELMVEFGALEPEAGYNFEDIVRETTPMGHENDTPMEKEAWVQSVISYRRENAVYESVDRTCTGTWLRAEGFDTEEGGTVSIFTDISESKQHEQDLAALVAEADLAHSRLNDAVGAIGQGFALFDSEDKYILFNKKYQNMKRSMGEEAIAGVSFENSLRNAARTDYGDETKDQWIERILKSRVDERSGLVTDELGDGSWFLFERFDTAEKGKVDIFTDVTEMKTHETELDALVKELGIARDAAVKANSAKSQFLANMSHELRTPLNAIIGYSELLIDDVADDENEDYIPDLAKIKSSGKHLLGLINDILDLSKVEVGKTDLFIEEFDLTELLNEVGDTIRPLVENNQNVLDIQVSDDITTMQSDTTKLRQNLFNLLSNAAKFSKGSTISLRVYRKHRGTGDLIAFEVQDEGIGMTEEQLENIFEPFTQADSSTSKRFGGTGLGLTITREFSRIMGGDVTVVSQIGEGTTFTMNVLVNARPSTAFLSPGAI